MSRYVGIHLGLNHSSIAISDRGSPEIIPNAEGQKKTPSVVSFREGEALVGQHAKRQMITNPKSTIWSIQRHMGTTGWKFRVNGKDYIPQEISARILLKLKRDAEAYLGEPVTGAVITVPAFFNQSQRQATLEAGQIAGLKVERIIPEPVAAALAYGINEFAEQTIMVVDLGSEICDLTILGTRGQGLEVQTTSRVLLGGGDWDKAIIRWLTGDFPRDKGIDLPYDTVLTQRVREAAEKAKIELSDASETDINLPFFATSGQHPIHLESTLTRTTFENITRNLLKCFAESIQQVLDESHTLSEDIAHVVLVGGSTRMPAIQLVVGRVLGREIRQMVSPDDAVALGAALSAGTINRDITDVLLLERLDLEDTVKGKSTQQGKRPLIVNHGENATASSNHGVDVTRHNKYEGRHPLNNTYSNRPNLLHSFPHNLWIKTDAIKPYLAIVKNSRLPTSNTITVFATRNYRGEIRAVVSERESGVLGNPGTWGPFLISGLPQRPKRMVQVDYTIGIDSYGNIYLVALASDTGKHYPFTISSNNILSSHEIIQLVTDLERKRKDHLQRTKLIELMNLDIFGVFIDCFQASLQERGAKADTQDMAGGYLHSASLNELSQTYETERIKLKEYLRQVIESLDSHTLNTIFGQITADPATISLTTIQDAHRQLINFLRPLMD